MWRRENSSQVFLKKKKALHSKDTSTVNATFLLIHLHSTYYFKYCLIIIIIDIEIQCLC